MNIALINGSPKPNGSNSGILLSMLEPLIADGNELHPYTPNKRPLTPEEYSELCRMDVLVLAFPCIMTEFRHTCSSCWLPWKDI